jgi:hypothetical protein
MMTKESTLFAFNVVPTTTQPNTPTPPEGVYDTEFQVWVGAATALAGWVRTNLRCGEFGAQYKGGGYARYWPLGQRQACIDATRSAFGNGCPIIIDLCTRVGSSGVLSEVCCRQGSRP